MNPVRLPISGQSVRFRPLTGADEMLLWSSGFSTGGVADAATDLRLAVALAERVTETERPETLDPSTLPVTDLDALLLRFRAVLFGETIQAEAKCPGAQCGAKMDVSFRISEYLESQAPETPRGVRRRVSESGDHAATPSWFGFGEGGHNDVLFRAPTVGDLQAIAWEYSPEDALFARCVRSEGAVDARTRRRIESALASIAPNLNGEIDGVCPDCENRVAMTFAPRAYVLRELRGYAAFVTEEVHLLAATYHWSEADILALPASRRKAYAERIREMYRGSNHSVFAEGKGR